MDFDIGNILYVVITLVAIIASLLGKKKRQSGKKAKPGFFENLEQVLKMGQEDPVVMDLQGEESDLQVEREDADYEYVNEESSIVDGAPSLDEDYNKMLQGRARMSFDEMPAEGVSDLNPMEVVDLEESDDPDYFEIIKDFDARTAVIYSAIINRLNY
jgi:hypothetical protein